MAVKMKPKTSKFWKDRARLIEAYLAEAKGQITRLMAETTIPDGGSSSRVSDLTIPRAYALIPAKTSGGVPAWHLLKFEVKDGVVISVDKSVENLRGVHLVEIENDILRDA